MDLSTFNRTMVSVNKKSGNKLWLKLCASSGLLDWLFRVFVVVRLFLNACDIWVAVKAVTSKYLLFETTVVQFFFWYSEVQDKEWGYGSCLLILVKRALFPIGCWLLLLILVINISYCQLFQVAEIIEP